MGRKRHRLTPFSLSFLDIMSCGFGAVVLLFLILKHHIDVNRSEPRSPPDLGAEIRLLQQDLREERHKLAELSQTLARLDQELSTARQAVHRSQRRAQGSESDKKRSRTDAEAVARLRTRIDELQAKKQQLLAERRSGEHIRAFAGEGRRQYLTGLKLGGGHILILLDASASMLDETIVNIIRRRNMSGRRKLQGAEKWRQATRIVDWLSAHLPPAGRYQIYVFNTEVQPAVPGSLGKWLRADDTATLNDAVNRVKRIIPAGGTSLEKAFTAVKQLRPLPDNIYLITDGLPTQGRHPSPDATIPGEKRFRLFNEAVGQLPGNIPVNVMLLPLEGDPLAAYSFWRLAILSRGSFITPAADWP